MALGVRVPVFENGLTKLRQLEMRELRSLCYSISDVFSGLYSIYICVDKACNNPLSRT